MRRALIQLTRGRGILIAIIAILVPILAGCHSTAAVPDDAPDGADRLIFERKELTEGLDADAPALAHYVDARQYLEEIGFTLAEEDEETLLLVTDPKQVEDDLALRIEAHVKPAPGGSTMLVSADYATDVNAATGAWQEAAWTGGLSKDAFRKTFERMNDFASSDLLIGHQTDFD